MGRLYLLNLPADRKESVERLSALTGLTQAELLRRMVDYCLQDGVLNVLVPPMSGQMSANLRRD